MDYQQTNDSITEAEEREEAGQPVGMEATGTAPEEVEFQDSEEATGEEEEFAAPTVDKIDASVLEEHTQMEPAELEDEAGGEAEADKSPMDDSPMVDSFVDKALADEIFTDEAGEAQVDDAAADTPEDAAQVEDASYESQTDAENAGNSAEEDFIEEPQGQDQEEGHLDAVAALARDIEALLFISPQPVSLEVLAEVTGIEGEELSHAVEAVRGKFSDPAGGIVFAELAGGYTFRTSDSSRGAVERYCRRPVDYTLSAAAMETLAIIAHLQPITRPEIAKIRGVGADTVVVSLLDKGLVMEAGRASRSGAVQYRTTEAFEKLFGLADLSGLPQLEGFEATPEDVEELREKLHLAAEGRQ